jgi:hypothetical protein
METPKQVVKGRPFLGTHIVDEGIREWFVREDWLLTDRDVQLMLTLRRCLAAGYYNEWGTADPSEGLFGVSLASAENDVVRAPGAVE